MKERRKRIFLNAEIEKERQGKEQLFLKWLRPRIIMTSEKNFTSKNKRNVTKAQKRIWVKKCLEIQSYLGSEKSSESWKFISNICLSNSGKSKLNNCRYMRKILFKTFSRST